jgi:hypothetical protein
MILRNWTGLKDQFDHEVFLVKKVAWGKRGGYEFIITGFEPLSE